MKNRLILILTIFLFSGCAIGTLSIGPDGALKIDAKLPTLGNKESK